jgi:hypothetical protein
MEAQQAPLFLQNKKMQTRGEEAGEKIHEKAVVSSRRRSHVDERVDGLLDDLDVWHKHALQLLHHLHQQLLVLQRLARPARQGAKQASSGRRHESERSVDARQEVCDWRFGEGDKETSVDIRQEVCG